MSSILNNLSLEIIKDMKESNLTPNFPSSDTNIERKKMMDVKCKSFSKTNLISPYLAKFNLNSNRNLLNLSVLHTYLSSYSTLPHLNNYYKVLELLQLMASNWPRSSQEHKIFEERYRWKISNLVIWFVCTNGSVFIDIGLIKKYKFDVFYKSMNGKNLIHFLCEKNSYIDLERLVQALEISYFDEGTHELFGDKLSKKNYSQRRKILISKFDIGDDECLDTPAHLSLIYNSHECFDILMKLGVDLTIPNARGWSASDLIQKFNPLKVSQEIKFVKSDATNRMVTFLKKTILYSAKNQSMVNKLMKSPNPKKDILLLNNIMNNTKFRSSQNYTMLELE